MNWNITFVGLDVHKESIVVALLRPGEDQCVEWSLKNDPRSAKRLAKKFLELSEGSDIRVCYEAGPTGYVLQRKLQALGLHCDVIAPSLIPKKPGERVKTDRRDARKLARSYRAGTLTPVHPPSEEEESVRDLCRARESAMEDRARHRHRLGKFLLRRGMQFAGKNWTQAHHRWLRSLRAEDDVAQAVLDAYLHALEVTEARLADLDRAVDAIAETDPYAEPVGMLRCFRGIDTVTAVCLVAELHSFERFTSPREFSAFLGIVPGEYSSGSSRRQGSITKAGNAHVRRLLIEAAWHARHKPHISKKLAARREGQPGWAVATADKAMKRLHKKYWGIANRKRPTQVAVVATARELSGFVWAVLYQYAINTNRIQQAA